MGRANQIFVIVLIEKYLSKPTQFEEPSKLIGLDTGVLSTKLLKLIFNLNLILKLSKYLVFVKYYNTFKYLIKYLVLYLVFRKLSIKLSMILSFP